MITDTDLLEFEGMMEGLRLREEDMPVSRAPDELVGKHGQPLAIFHSPAYGFSNSFPSSFTVLGRQFYTLDQYFVWQKARYFGDVEMAQHVMLITNAVKIRRLSQRIRGFELEAWNNVRDKIMYVGLWAKFSQNAVLYQQLLATGDAVIALATVASIYWGNGVSPSNVKRLSEPAVWNGENRLGTLLMELRTEIRNTIY